MPTRIVTFACDICNEEYDTEEDARRCEDLGTPVSMRPGFIFSLASKSGGVVAVATYSRERGCPHYANWTGWLCEPNKPIIGPLCGPRISNKSEMVDPRQYTSEFDRMVAHLREQLPAERLMFFDGEFAKEVDGERRSWPAN